MNKEESSKKKGLGRGLSSLIPSAATATKKDVKEDPNTSAYKKLLITDLSPSESQPRRYFDAKALEELSSSIALQGILQPIVVRQKKSGSYEIIAGERRWRAAGMAKLKMVPCIITELADKDVLSVALVENLQRQDLTAIEEAESFRRLIDELNFTQEQVAKAVGKDRSTITNSLRLLKLPVDVQSLLESRQLSMGHARALLAAKDAKVIKSLAQKIVAEGLSVRKAEELAQGKVEARAERKEAPARKESTQIKNVRLKLERTLGTRVEVSEEHERGRIVIHFADFGQLDFVLSRLNIAL